MCIPHSLMPQCLTSRTPSQVVQNSRSPCRNNTNSNKALTTGWLDKEPPTDSQVYSEWAAMHATQTDQENKTAWLQLIRHVGAITTQTETTAHAAGCEAVGTLCLVSMLPRSAACGADACTHFFFVSYSVLLLYRFLILSYLILRSGAACGANAVEILNSATHFALWMVPRSPMKS